MRVQIEMLRLRLEKFAEVQARWRSEGLEDSIEPSSRSSEGDVIFDADDGADQPGRPDRSDRRQRANGRSGRARLQIVRQRQIAGSNASRGPVGDKQWIDFQLPLYRYLVRSLDLPEPVQLGYVLLPKDIDKTEVRNGRVDGGGIGRPRTPRRER